MTRFRWIGWNLDHIAEHGVAPREAEWVATHPLPGFPRRRGDGYVVWGQSPSGRWLQVLYAREQIGEERVLFVYHARPLTEREKRRV